MGDLRRVTLYDADNSRRLIFWSNLWSAPVAVVAEAYHQRWQIELFFRWLKHGLRIQTFYGTSDNAVLLQLWVSICVYIAMAGVPLGFGEAEIAGQVALIKLAGGAGVDSEHRGEAGEIACSLGGRVRHIGV